MNYKDLQLVLDVLSVRADELKIRVDSHQKYLFKLEHLVDEVRKSSLNPDTITDLIFVLKEKDTHIWTELTEMNAKISSIDAFIGEITQSINDNDESCIYCELESD